MTVHLQKNNKLLSLLLPFVLVCCLFCVSLPAASAASPDEGLTEGRFCIGSTPMNSNVERVVYGGSDHYYFRTGQIGDFSDGSSFSPYSISGYFVSSGDGFVTVSYPAFDITVPRSGGPAYTSAPTQLSFRVSSVENGNSTGADYPVTGSSYQVGSDSSTSTARTKPGSFRFPVVEGGRYSVSLRSLFQFDANSKVGSLLVVQSFSPITFTTSSNDVKLRPYNSGSRPVVGLDVAFHPVTVLAPDGCTVNPLEGYSFPVEEGAGYRFTVDIGKGYRKTDSFSVKANGRTLSPGSSGYLAGCYFVGNPTDEQTIEVTGVEEVGFSVTLPDVEGCRLSPCEGYSSPVKPGGDFHFSVEIEEGYTWGGLDVYANGKSLDYGADTNIFVIRNIMEDQIVEIKGVKKRPQYNIFLPEGEGYDISPRFDNPVYGDTVHQFKVIILDGYRQSDSFAVRCNGEVMTPYLGGWYTFSGLKEDAHITIEGVERAGYMVTLSDDVEGCRISPYEGFSLPVAQGEDYGFLVELEEGYWKTSAFAVYANGKWLSPFTVGKYYVINNVTADQIVTVMGVEKIPEYYITFSEGEGYRANPRFTCPVDGSSVARFTVEILDGYRKTDSFVVRADGEPLAANSDGVYVLNHIAGNIHVTIEGVEKIPPSYPVTFPADAKGYTVVTAIPGDGSNFFVEEGSSFSFMIRVDYGYRKSSSFAVKANGVKLNAVDNVYTIEDVREPQRITVDGVVFVFNPGPGNKPDYDFDADTKTFVFSVVSLFDSIVSTALGFPVLLFFGSVAVFLICFAIFQRLYNRGKRGRNH